MWAVFGANTLCVLSPCPESLVMQVTTLAQRVAARGLHGGQRTPAAMITTLLGGRRALCLLPRAAQARKASAAGEQRRKQLGLAQALSPACPTALPHVSVRAVRPLSSSSSSSEDVIIYSSKFEVRRVSVRCSYRVWCRHD